jgi:predicted site-specific integrase-resolvase
MEAGTIRLRADKAAEFLDVSVATLAKWRWLGVGPRFIRVGRSIRYPVEELQKHLDMNTHQSTSEY